MFLRRCQIKFYSTAARITTWWWILTRCLRSKNSGLLISWCFIFLWSWTIAAHEIKYKHKLQSQFSWQTIDSFCKNSSSFNHNYTAGAKWISRRPTLRRIGKSTTGLSKFQTTQCKQTIQSKINDTKQNRTRKKIHIKDLNSQ